MDKKEIFDRIEYVVASFFGTVRAVELLKRIEL